ncbi:MAG: hypothetical protein LBD48_09265 [Treponema sp.]|jgi:hypothetical protein|nr:hypothetical protein [Treponema sp.]
MKPAGAACGQKKQAKPTTKTAAPQSIGTRNESSLHRMLKFRYAGPQGKTEAEVAGYVADGISACGEFIEVQTGSFGPLKQKATSLAQRGTVRIIHPVIINKYIEVFSADGKRQYRRKSPRTGSVWDLFKALLYAPELPLVPGLCIELVLVDVTERRLQDGKGSWRRKGVSIADRALTAWHETIPLNRPTDYLRFAPFKKNEEFTVSMLAEQAGIARETARKTLYVLTRMRIVQRVGKRKNAFVYKIGCVRDSKKNG